MLLYNQVNRKHNQSQGGVPMADTMNNLPGAVSAASALAEVGGEDFVIAITAAYMAGLEKGKKEAA